MLSKNTIVSLFAISLLTLSTYSFASPFIIVPVGTLPTTVPEGGSVTAAYTVTSGMRVQRDGNFVKSLPKNVTVSGTSCGTTFNLAPGASCTLNLVISGAANGVTNPLYVCASDGFTCSGTNYPLNVTETSGPVVPIAQYPMLIPFQFALNEKRELDGPYAIDSTNGPLPADFVGNGFFNAVSCGSSSCIAVGKYTASSSEVYPMIAKGDTTGSNWSYVIDKTTGSLPPGYSAGGNFDTVSCSGTTCVAGGRYQDGTTSTFLMMAVSTDAGDTWTYPISNNVSTWPASFAPLTANAANFTDVDCVDANRCVASGTYTASVSAVTHNYPLVAITTNAGSTWTYPIELGAGLPGDFSTAGAFNSVDCTGSGTTAVCAVGGTYNNSSAVYPLLATSANTGGTWTYRVSSANAPTAFDDAGVINGVACSGATTTSTCAGVGSYTNNIAEQTMFFALGVNAGAGSPTWSFPIESGSILPSTYNAQASFSSVSCTGATSSTICAAGGSYSAGDQPIPMLAVTTDNGTSFGYLVQNGTGEPSVTVTTGTFTDASCTQTGGSPRCILGGQYTDGGVQYPMVMLSLDGGISFSYAVQKDLRLPSDFDSAGNMNAVLCNSSFCMAAGEYVNQATFVNEENAWNYWMTEVNTLRTDYHPKLLANVNVPLSPMASLGIAPLGNESSTDNLIEWLSRFFV